MTAFDWDDGPRMNFAGVKGAVSLKEYAEDVLDHARGGLVCPACGSGTGPHKTPAFSIKKNGSTWKCFACGAGGDVFDLAGAVEGTDDKRAQYEAVCRWAGMPCEGAWTAPSKGRPSGAPKKEPKAAEPVKSGDGTPEGRGRESEYVEACQAALFGVDARGIEYARARGFTDEEAAALGFGYDARARRLVIPWNTGGGWYHVARDVTGEAPNKYMTPRADDVGGKPLFGVDALDAGGAVWVVEGVLDALAIEACGGRAVACLGLSTEKVVNAARARCFRGAIVCAMDYDEDPRCGPRANADLAAALDAAGVVHVEATELQMCCVKDAAELLALDRDKLAGVVAAVEARAGEALEARAGEEYSEACRALRMIDPFDLVRRVWDCEGGRDPVPTGLRGLDEALGGGLPRGLCVVGAVSSFGKTTLVGQVADDIAAGGRPVLFVTIEQGADELVRKSIARRMWRDGAGSSEAAVSARSIGTPAARARWSGSTDAAFRAAAQAYIDDVSPRLRMMEGTGQPSVSDIAAAARLMADRHGAAPVVIVDYLQLLRPPADRLSDKQALDQNVMGLRQMARDMGTSVVVVSSLNRQSYSGVVSFDSFKESGGIEYGADVLLGLQPRDVGEALDGLGKDKREAEAARIMERCRARAVRDVEVRVLKNRDGAAGRAAPLVLHCIPGAITDAEEPGGIVL